MGSVQSFIQRTALRQASIREFYGLYRGFPLGLTLLGCEVSAADLESGSEPAVPRPMQPYSLLIHIRFRDRGTEAPTQPSHIWSEHLRKLLEEGQARVSVEPRIAWLTLYEPNDLVASETAIDVLDAFIDGLVAAGVQNAGERCHYCEKTVVKEPTYVTERVAWICPACLAARISDAQPNEPAAPLDGLKLLFAAGLGAVIGAAAWAGLWIGYDSIMEWLAKRHPSATIWVPHIVLAVLAFGAALFVGGPSGVLVRRAAYRGYFARTVISCCGAVAAIAMGEVAWVLWLLPQLPGVLTAIRVLPTVWSVEGRMHFGLRLLVAGLSVYLAFQLAKPSRRQIQI